MMRFRAGETQLTHEERRGKKNGYMNQNFASTLSAAALCALPAFVCTACKPQAAAEDPAVAALRALAARVTPEYAGKVDFVINPQLRQPLISADHKAKKLIISAADRAEGARAYGYYLRNIAHVHFSWNGDNRSGAAFVLPKQAEIIAVPATRPYNYALNYCTISYSATHWDKERWQHELDCFALNGYKYILVTAGLEKVWQGFLSELGCPQEKITGFIPNPAYSAWWNMGNLEGEGGPLSQTLLEEEAELGRFIVKHMTELGMEPVLQGYVGFLPHDFTPAGLQGTIIPQGKWVADYERPSVLEPTSPDFPKLAEIWYRHLEETYGYRAKAFGGDLFHEGGESGEADLAACAKAVQKAMQKAAPGADWFLQAWAHNPDEELLQGVDKEHTVVLLLDKDLTPKHDPYYRRHRYLRRPQVQGFRTVWCELSNFGGNQGLYGGMELLEKLTPQAEGPMGAMARDAVGMGMISEGVETNPLFYALLTERLNNIDTPIDRREFLTGYALARYGCADEGLLRALELLADSVYHPDGMREGCWENLLCARPSLTADRTSTWSSPAAYYEPEEVELAARLMLEAGRRLGLDKLETFRYDMADVTRQVLSDRAHEQLPVVHEAYEHGELAVFLYEKEKFMDLIAASGEILATSEHFLLGRYLQGAEAKGGDNEADRRSMRENLLRLITTWSTGNTSLNDYAHRQLAELMTHYYMRRWDVFFDDKARALMSAVDLSDPETSGDAVSNNGDDVTYFYEENAAVDAVQDTFPTAAVPLLYKPQGNVLEVAERVLLPRRSAK